MHGVHRGDSTMAGDDGDSTMAGDDGDSTMAGDDGWLVSSMLGTPADQSQGVERASPWTRAQMRTGCHGE